jgi:hypothetical protein
LLSMVHVHLFLKWMIPASASIDAYGIGPHPPKPRLGPIAGLGPLAGATAAVTPEPRRPGASAPSWRRPANDRRDTAAVKGAQGVRDHVDYLRVQGNCFPDRGGRILYAA